MVTFRQLVNSAILNAEEWINFMGDSEYCNENDEYHLGYWAFLDLVDTETNQTLDSTISENKINGVHNIKNDNGTICKIQLFY